MNTFVKVRTYISIFLLTIFVGYQSGHSFIYWLLEKRIDQIWQYKIDNGNINSQKVIEKSFPLISPYQTYRPDFIESNMGLEIDGKYYRMIKHRYSRDTLYVAFLEDTLKENLSTAFLGLSADSHGPLNSDQQKQNLLWLLQPKPVLPVQATIFNFNKHGLLTYSTGSKYHGLFSQCYIEVPNPPPSII